MAKPAHHNRENNQLVTRSLPGRVGIRAVIAANGREALDMLKLLHYDLALMDCHMPEMNGYEAAAEIRKLEGINHATRIVAMTSDAMAGSRERCLAAGMDGLLASR